MVFLLLLRGKATGHQVCPFWKQPQGSLPTGVISSLPPELTKTITTSHALIGRMAKSQCLERQCGGHREGNPGKYEGYSSYNLIHIQQDPALLPPNNLSHGHSRDVTLRQPKLSSSRWAGRTKSLQSPLEKSNKTVRFLLKEKFHVLPRFSSRCSNFYPPSRKI